MSEDHNEFVTKVFERWMPIYAAGIVIFCWVAAAVILVTMAAGFVARALS